MAYQQAGEVKVISETFFLNFHYHFLVFLKSKFVYFKQVAVVRPKEHSVCLIDDYDQGLKLNQMRRKAIDSLLSSKKSLDERGNNHVKNLNGKFKIEDIVDRVKNPSKYSNTIFRPDILALKDCPQYLTNAIRLCWAENAETRPDMKQVNSMLRQLQSGL